MNSTTVAATHRVAAMSLMLLAACTANADVFGLRKGMTAEEISELSPGILIPRGREGLRLPQEGATEFGMSRAGLPLSNDLFDYYTLHVSQKEGLCGIQAMTADKQRFEDTASVRERLLTALNDLYGHSRIVERPLTRILWLSTDEAEPFVEAEWRASDNEPLPNDVAFVFLATQRSKDGSTIRMAVEYIFNNYERCDDLAIDAFDKRGL